MKLRTLFTILLPLVFIAACTTPLDVSIQPTPSFIDTLPTSPLPPGASIEEPGTYPGTAVLTTGLLGSLRPDDHSPAERVPQIIERGYILVGVDQSQNLLSFRDPTTSEMRGFEIDLAREIAFDIFGDPTKVDFRFVDSTDSVYALESKQVDIVIQSMTITRQRQDQVFFSTPYLSTRTRLLVPDSSTISEISDLANRRVCVADNSTALQRTRQLAPEATIMKVRNWADCLMALQQDQIDAIVSDDAILSGINAQDPYTKIVGKPIMGENYGVAIATPGINHHTTGLIRQVNSTIERIEHDNTWWKLYKIWFAKYQGTSGPPPLSYRKED